MNFKNSSKSAILFSPANKGVKTKPAKSPSKKEGVMY
jgi:hypothetical protein